MGTDYGLCLAPTGRVATHGVGVVRREVAYYSATGRRGPAPYDGPPRPDIF